MLQDFLPLIRRHDHHLPGFDAYQASCAFDTMTAIQEKNDTLQSKVVVNAAATQSEKCVIPFLDDRFRRMGRQRETHHENGGFPSACACADPSMRSFLLSRTTPTAFPGPIRAGSFYMEASDVTREVGGRSNPASGLKVAAGIFATLAMTEKVFSSKRFPLLIRCTLLTWATAGDITVSYQQTISLSHWPLELKATGGNILPGFNGSAQAYRWGEQIADRDRSCEDFGSGCGCSERSEYSGPHHHKTARLYARACLLFSRR